MILLQGLWKKEEDGSGILVAALPVPALYGGRLKCPSGLLPSRSPVFVMLLWWWLASPSRAEAFSSGVR